MVNSALGIIFPNTYDELVPELVEYRLMASVPFASRYRLIDFVLSSMVHSGIDNISVLARQNYHSLMDHLGAGREWDLTRKNGGLTIWPPFAEKSMNVYSGRVEALAHIEGFLKGQKEKYVIITDANIAVNFDFRGLIEQHAASGADITCVYAEEELPESAKSGEMYNRGFFYTYAIEDGLIKAIHINPDDEGIQNLGMNIYCMDREYLISLVKEAYETGKVYFERDVLVPGLNTMKVAAYKYEGYCSRITSMKSYFDENLKLLCDENRSALFDGGQIYTKLRDDNPTRYIAGASVKNVMAADGCVIEGTVENCVLFRGVKIGKGAVVKDCVLMQDTVIEDGAKVEYLITDKDVVIGRNKELKGTETFPVYAKKRRVV